MTSEICEKCGKNKERDPYCEPQNHSPQEKDNIGVAKPLTDNLHSPEDTNNHGSDDEVKHLQTKYAFDEAFSEGENFPQNHSPKKRGLGKPILKIGENSLKIQAGSNPASSKDTEPEKEIRESDIKTENTSSGSDDAIDNEVIKNIVLRNATELDKENDASSLSDKRILKLKRNRNPKDKFHYFYPEKDVKEFVKKRIYDATMLLGLFNSGKLTSIDLREHRQRIKDDAGSALC